MPRQSPTYSQTASSTAASTRHLLGGQHAALPLTARSAAAAKANAAGTAAAATQPSVAACTSVSVATEADAGHSPIVIASIFSPTSAGATPAATSGAGAHPSFAEAPVRASVNELEQTDASAAPPVEIADARKPTFKGAAMAVVAATSLRLAGRRRSVNVSDMKNVEAEDPDAQPANQLWSLLAVLSAVQVFTGASPLLQCLVLAVSCFFSPRPVLCSLLMQGCNIQQLFRTLSWMHMRCLRASHPGVLSQPLPRSPELQAPPPPSQASTSSSPHRASLTRASV
jgi:hypothetical protein